jgi:hypothetical protein
MCSESKLIILIPYNISHGCFWILKQQLGVSNVIYNWGNLIRTTFSKGKKVPMFAWMRTSSRSSWWKDFNWIHTFHWSFTLNYCLYLRKLVITLSYISHSIKIEWIVMLVRRSRRHHWLEKNQFKWKERTIYRWANL